MEAVKNKYMYYTIKGFENYAISIDGKVINVITGKIRKLKLTKAGYLSVNLTKDKKIYHKYIHRLLCETFKEQVIGKNYVNHIDGNKLNNDLNNLEWCTPKENIIHAYSIGLFKGSDLQKSVAALNCIKRRKKVIDIKSGYIYFTVDEAAKSININLKTLYAMLNGQNKNKTNFIYG